MVPAREWLAPPPSVEIVRAGNPQPRTFSPRHRDAPSPRVPARPRLDRHHALLPASRRARAEPGRRILGHSVGRLLRRHQPALVRRRVGRSQSRAVAHGVPDAAVRLRGGHCSESVRISPRSCSGYGVTHLLSSFPGARCGAPARWAATANAYVYRIDGAARVRFVPGARHLRRRSREASSRPGASIPIARVLLATRPLRRVRPSTSRLERASGAPRPGPPSSARPRPRSSSRRGAGGRIPAARRHVLSGLDRGSGRKAGAALSRESLSARDPAAEGAARGAVRLRAAGRAARSSDQRRGARDAAGLAGAALYGAKGTRNRLVEAD